MYVTKYSFASKYITNFFIEMTMLFYIKGFFSLFYSVLEIN